MINITARVVGRVDEGGGDSSERDFSCDSDWKVERRTIVIDLFVKYNIALFSSVHRLREKMLTIGNYAD